MLIQNYIIPENLPDGNKLPDCSTCLIGKVLIRNIVAKIDFQDRLKVPVSDSFGQDFQKRIPMMTPLDATILHVVLCGAGAAMFSFGLGTVSNMLLSKRDLV